MAKILLLDIGNTSTERIYAYLLSRLEPGTITKVSVNEQKTGDFLLLPDTGGLNCNTSGFIPHFRVPPKYKGQDQWMEFWRIEHSEFYINSGIRTIGFGTSAFLLYVIALGGKLTINSSEELELIENKGLALVEGNKWSSSLHTGYVSGDLTENLIDFLSLLAGHRAKSDEGGELVTANVGTPIVPPRMGLKTNF